MFLKLPRTLQGQHLVEVLAGATERLPRGFRFAPQAFGPRAGLAGE